jgi:N-acetylglutamate synthase-like GNAT family acetyltransferase
MTATPQYVARRATVEDLPQLVALWRLEQLPADVLEKRFTEFQVVSDETGQVLATVGFQIVGTQALLHSEAIAKPELGDSLRERLWNRFQAIIQNHALERLWTQINVPFWREKGFERASAERITSLPAQFSANDREWLMKTLRAADANAAVERELAQLKAMQHEESVRMQQRVQWAKRLAFGITIVVFLLVVIWAVAMLKFGPKVFGGR